MRGPSVLQVNVSKTWLDVLNGDLSLEVTKEKGFFLCSLTYCPSKPLAGKGWRAELTDSVANFVARFERKRPKYRVRICHPYDITIYNTNVSPKRNINESIIPPINEMPPPKAPSQGRHVVGSRRPTIVIPVQVVPEVDRESSTIPQLSGQSSQIRKRPADAFGVETLGRLRNLKSVMIEVAEEADLNDTWKQVPPKDPSQQPARQEREEFNDNDSLCTALSDKEAEFLRDGIEVRDVKGLAVRKLSNVSNAVLLRIEKEIESLKESNKWQRNVLRSPLTCWLVQKLFQE